jgi:hypothetical protein
MKFSKKITGLLFLSSQICFGEGSDVEKPHPGIKYPTITFSLTSITLIGEEYTIEDPITTVTNYYVAKAKKHHHDAATSHASWKETLSNAAKVGRKLGQYINLIAEGSVMKGYVTVEDIRFDVEFYCCKTGKRENVTVNGSDEATGDLPIVIGDTTVTGGTNAYLYTMIAATREMVNKCSGDAVEKCEQ